MTKLHSLESDQFREALESYIDYNKPDPMARRQLESWKMTWSNQTEAKEQQDFKAKHAIVGTLELRGEYVSVSLDMECFWRGEHDKGRLTYTCTIQSHTFIDKKDDDDDDDKARRKIRKKMCSRLGKDSYIAKLSDNKQLFSATIDVDDSRSKLEERVDVSDDVAEGLKRAVWSSTATSIDVVDVLLWFPSLPCASSSAASKTNTTTTTTTTKLANRAKLRLLEDAMLDECEKAGEDELIDDLSISKENKKDDNEDEQPRKTNKKSRR
jgi:hypothetical protein